MFLYLKNPFDPGMPSASYNTKEIRYLFLIYTKVLYLDISWPRPPLLNVRTWVVDWLRSLTFEHNPAPVT